MATIRKRGNSYQIRVSTGYDINGNQVIRTKTWKPSAGMTQKQIENELNKQKVLFEQQCERGIVPVDVKFQTLADQWFDEYANANLKKSTIQRFKSVSIRIYKAFGHLRVDKITHGQIQAFIDDLSRNQKNMLNGKPLSRKSVVHHLNLLSDIFNYAIRLEMIEFNPCSHIYIPKGEKKEKQIYTVDEMKQLFRLVVVLTVIFAAMVPDMAQSLILKAASVRPVFGRSSRSAVLSPTATAENIPISTA